MKMKKMKADINVYLAKGNIADPFCVVRDREKLKQMEVKIDNEIIGTIFIKKTRANPPKWANFFRSVIALEEFGQNSSTGALLIVEANGRIFMLAFGQGRYLINSEFIEIDYGLRVALNCVNEKSLRCIDKCSFETHPKQSREQSGKATDLQYFGIDVERDLLRAVTGKPKDKKYGERISGMDSLKLTPDIDLVSIKSLLSDTLIKYNDGSYKKGDFAWVDHIGEIKDISLTQQLDNLLISQVKKGETNKIWLSLPEIIDWNRAFGFKYSSSARASHFYDVRLNEFIKVIGDVEIDKNLLMRRKIYCVDADNAPILDRPAYYYFYAEISFKGSSYLLNNGKWYRINDDYAKQINDFYARIDRYERSLPVYEHEDEGDYNKRVATNYPDEFVLLDSNNIKVPGSASPVEPCDLYRRTREFIHVKRYGGSSVLSHLFNQGLVSGNLFQMDQKFRKLFNEKLPVSHKISDIDSRPATREYSVVYAVISEHDEDLSIPFFSKISLKHAVNHLSAIGYNVKITNISVSEKTKKTQKCAPARAKL